MPGGFPQPYRGQPRPKFPRPRKQIRDLRLEARQNIVSAIKAFLVFSSPFILLAWLAADLDHKLRIALVCVGLILGTLATIAAANGLKTINKFRKGYDVDISDEHHKKVEKPSDEL